jgi:hypothetical protein
MSVLEGYERSRSSNEEFRIPNREVMRIMSWRTRDSVRWNNSHPELFELLYDEQVFTRIYSISNVSGSNVMLANFLTKYP